VTVSDDPRSPGQVTLATVHRVKGLEWERVIVLDAHDGLMPHRLSEDLEEERRVFHVALTRCREQVVLLADEAAETPFVDDLTREPEPFDPTATVETRLERSRRTAPQGSFTAPGAAPTDPLDEALRAWRLERSRADSVPAYVVLSNATVAEIAAAQPRNNRELSRISGIGPTKLERYGADILSIVNSSLEGAAADL
jgi:DNA helicase-2/ATP-dependent DNA helicase PcrA